MHSLATTPHITVLPSCEGSTGGFNCGAEGMYDAASDDLASDGVVDEPCKGVKGIFVRSKITFQSLEENLVRWRESICTYAGSSRQGDWTSRDCAPPYRDNKHR